MLSNSELEKLLQNLKDMHSGDDRQLEVIFSESKRLIVEAPAGYGKTKTMISKVAYILATQKVSHPKKILALTFSVNAAYKIKKDITEHLPYLLQPNKSNRIKITDRLFVSNYHGFCRSVLKKYGYLLHPNLSNLDSMKSIDDSKTQEVTSSLKISTQKALDIAKFSDAIKNVDTQTARAIFNEYTEEIINTFLDRNYISFNGVLALTLKLFGEYGEINKFYQSYFPVIIVDEFQDTNTLSWALLSKLVSEETQLVFMGDSLQRIYGFIGAIPNLMSVAERKFSMDRIVLGKNYRFMSNPQMLQLDRNIRLNAENPESPDIETDAIVPLVHTDTQTGEALAIADRLESLLTNEEDKLCKIAILVKQRGKNINQIIDIILGNNIPYFYALFGEEDYEYILFHRECSDRFTDYQRKDAKISEFTLRRFYFQIVDTFKDNSSSTIISLLRLLNIFLLKVPIDYAAFSNEDKLILIRDTFENKTLRQWMEYVDEKIIIATIHGAKGLEWDYVMMPDMEQYSLPNWYGLCGKCNYKSNCELKINSSNQKDFLEELSVFYVGVTRARKQVFFSASRNRYKGDGSSQRANLSCMLTLPGIVAV